MTYRVLVILTALSAAGCFGQPQLTWRQKMDSSAGVERTQAVMAVGERRNIAAIPHLIRSLEDDDVSVRMAAIDSLRQMTGKDFGYVAWDDEVTRRAAVKKWREWWSQARVTADK